MDIKTNNYAIFGHNLSLELGQSWKPVTIFKNLSIKVPKGAIYGLIGPSGCGKTTLQRCIFGFYRPTKGNLLVFGRSPLEKGFGVPGPLVGFMPQDLALNEDLTIKEMLTFFGRLSDLPIDTVNERIDELLKVIDIPYPDRLISNLSIGQRRRISLAASLIHRPKLLLLDEPTVGSDPLLVYKMWTYLFHLRDTYKMTIVVTTHYLEEIVKADRFGLMRKGQIIVEDNPMSFMEKYKETSLEKAVFRLCTEWDSRNKASLSSSSASPSNSPKLSSSVQTNGMVQKQTSTQQSTLDGQNTQIYNIQPPSSSSSSTFSSDPQSLASWSSSSSLTETWTPLSNFTVLIILMWRLWLRCQRFMIYPIILSCLIIFIITLTFGVMFGRFPKDLKMNYMNLGTSDRNITKPFLTFLSENSIILERVNSELESRLKLEKGLIDGYFIIGENFEESIREKIENGLSSLSHHVQHHVSGPKVKDKIFLTVDASNQFKFDTLVITISRSLTKLMHETQTNLNVTNNYYQFFKVTPIYESYEPDNLMASNENVLIRYFLYAVEQFTIILMMSWTIKEAHERMNERLMAAGISRTQLTMALIVTSTFVIVPIYLIFFTILIPTLNFPMRGSWIAVILSIIAITVCGISKGIFIGLLSNDLIMAAFLHSAYCFSSLFLGYLLWPYESLPDFIKPLTYWFPFALSSDSLVWSLMKGKAFTDVLVYQNIVYSIIFAIVSIILVLIGFNKW